MLGRRLFAKTLGAAVTCLALGFDPLARNAILPIKETVKWYPRFHDVPLWWVSFGEDNKMIRRSDFKSLPDPETERVKVEMEDCRGHSVILQIGGEVVEYADSTISGIYTADWIHSKEAWTKRDPNKTMLTNGVTNGLATLHANRD